MSANLFNKEKGFPDGSVVKSPLASRKSGFDPWIRKIPWRRKWQPTSVFVPGESHGQRSLAGTVHGGHEELDMTEHAHSRTGH